MAAKFKIFCDDDCPTSFEPEGKGKREPLGLRQTITHQHNHHQQQSQGLREPTVLSRHEDDQENDISMASLGSDFVPSILDEAEFNDSSEIEEASLDSEQNDHDIGDLLVADDDIDDDEDLQLELSQAFKRHDDSQLFKATVYIHDIESYLAKLEKVPELRPLPNYMNFQEDIDTKKRSILINWLVEVSDEYRLQTETLFICVSIIDRFLSEMGVSTSNFQLLGVAAMFIASKYEEIYPPFLNQFVEVTDDTYSGKQILQMEQEILKTLNFRISLPTVTLFLNKIFAFNKFPKKVFHLAEYLCHLSLLNDEPFLEYYPSEIALASVILAAHQLGSADNISSELKTAYDASNKAQLDRRQLPKGVQLNDIERRSFIVDQELPFCIESLRAIQECAHSRASKIQSDSAIYVKYTSEAYSGVALLPAPRVEDLLEY